jgi:hypothetical protein
VNWKPGDLAKLVNLNEWQKRYLGEIVTVTTHPLVDNEGTFVYIIPIDGICQASVNCLIPIKGDGTEKSSWDHIADIWQPAKPVKIKEKVTS